MLKLVGNPGATWWIWLNGLTSTNPEICRLQFRCY